MERDEAKLNEWREHCKKWQASGLTRKAYCEREGLSLTSYERWSRRVRSSDAQAAANQQAREAPKQRPGLVPVQVTSGPGHEGMVLRGPGRWELRVPAGVDAAWLAHVLKLLS